MACSDKARDTVLYGPDVDGETQTGPREPLMWFPERNEYGEKGNQEARYLHIAPFWFPLRAANVYCRIMVLLRYFHFGRR